MFIGAGMLAPIVARPIAGTLGRPLAALLGTPGRLGRENSMRSPRRTAQTAAALMVGLALVSTIAVIAELRRASDHKESPAMQGFRSAPERTRTSTDHKVHKALNLNPAG